MISYRPWETTREKNGGPLKQLTAKFVRDVTEPGRYYDGDAGLFLLVAYGKRGPRKSYVQRVTIAGKRRDIGLGSIRWLPLTDARAAAQANRRIARSGGDPRAKRSTVPTFAEALEKVLDVQRGIWRKGSKSEAQWRASLNDYAAALMGKRVDAIGPGDVLGVVAPIWNAKRETARRVRQRIGAVMRWSVAEGHRIDNPVDAIGAALPKEGRRQKHHKALPYAEVGEAIRRIQETNAHGSTRLALEFLILTACRSGEVRGALWSELDLDSATWTIPAERMKKGREHRVPLSPQALEVLAKARASANSSALVFPTVRGRVMSDSTMSKLLRENRIDAVPHGFRSSFRDWTSERMDVPRVVAEMALAHVEKDKTVAAYARSDLFERRRKLMEAWANFVADRGAQARGVPGLDSALA